MAFLFPTNRELSEIAPIKIERMSQQRVGLQIMPVRSVNAGIIQWYQRDNYFGLQQLRGLGGAPPHVRAVGGKLFSYTPGSYGEFMTIDETDLTIRAGNITVDVPIDVGDLVLSRQDQLMQRELDRIEFMNWTLLTTGTFSVALPGGAIGFTDTFPLQTYTRITPWATTATAVPLQDFRSVQLLGAGLGVNFGAGAVAWTNRPTANSLLNNTNAADIGGKRALGGATFNSLQQISDLLVADDLPRIGVYDEGYYDDTNTFQRFIPNNKVVVVGQVVNGEKIGEYLKTRNANNPGMAPGSYTYTVDRVNARNGEKRTPPNIEVHEGHNGGPVIYRPGSIVIMTV